MSMRPDIEAIRTRLSTGACWVMFQKDIPDLLDYIARLEKVRDAAASLFDPIENYAAEVHVLDALRAALKAAKEADDARE